MKKTFVLLLILALLAAVGIFAVAAETQPDSGAVWCDRCRKNVPANEWMEWTTTGGDFTEEGHFYLADTFTEQETTVNILALKFVCLDLRGNTWITEDIRTISVSGDFSVMDSVGGGRILTTGKDGQAGAFAYVGTAGALNLFDGTVQFVPRDDITISNGGLIYVDAGTVNVDGATVTGGVVSAASDKNAMGGNFYLTNGGRLNVVSGEITKGMVLAGSNQQGGNIYVTTDSIVTVSGGSVEEGYATSAGGNIFLANNAKLYVTNGTISGGMSPNRGGNIAAVSSGEALIDISGGTITDGVATGALKTYKDETDDDTLNPTCARGEYGGGNIYGRTPSGSLIISGGTVDGDILLDYMGNLTLTGAPKIGLGLSNGLKINNTGIDANISGLTEGAEIYVDASGVFTKALTNEAAATAALAYFKGAVRTAVAVSGNTLTATQGTQGYCPHCGNLVTWTAAVSATNDGDHIYLNGSKYNSGSNLIVSKDTVLDLNGYTLFRDGYRVIINYANETLKTLSVLDSWGGGKIEGTSTANADAGILYMYSKSELKLYSGTIRVSTSVKNPTAAKKVNDGGVIYAGGGAKITMHGGQITSGVISATGGSYGGGNISFGSTSGKLYLNGGIIRSGKAENSISLKGGNIYSAGYVEINGGIILGGQGASGGNIYSTKDVVIKGGIIWGGETANSGGNIYVKNLTMSGGLVAGGTSNNAEYGGGNIAISKGAVTISGDAVILSGKANYAGNIYCLQTTTLDIQGGLIAAGTATGFGGNIRMNGTDCVTNVTGGLITMGEAPTGGNAYVNNGTFTMTGGAVTAGKASKGGNLYFNNFVNVTFEDDGNAKTALPVISHGTATDGDGGNITFMAGGNTATEIAYSLQLGDCKIYDGSATGNGDNIYVNKTAKFEVLPAFNQQTTVYFHDDLIVNDIYLNNTYVMCNGTYTGTLLLENRSNLPKIITTQADPTLVIGQAALVMNDGSVQWFGSNADALAAYNSATNYIQPATGELALPTGTYTVDLTGQDLTLTGDGANVYCFDSANTNFEVYGTVKLSGPVLMNTVEHVALGDVYVTVAEAADTYSFHCLDMAVTSVSVRPGSAGIYYSCTWNCDDVLKNHITNFGVAVSIADMPGADFAEDKNTLYTQAPVAEFAIGKEFNSVLINNIFDSKATDNSTRGETPVYATPYVTLEGGKSIVCSGEFKHSLQSVLKLFDTKAYYANKPALESFHQKWQSAMADWEFANIGVKPQDDNTLRILMGGNSFAYYYVEELYGLLMENPPEGVKEVEIYNIYYSGRGFYTHWNLWQSGAEGDYHLFKTDKYGRRELTPIGKWTLEEVLAMENWDYIGLQGTGKSSAGSYAKNETWDAVCADISIYAEDLFGYIHEMFPYTQLLWHRTWAQEVGRVTNDGFVYTEEYNERYDPGMQYVCDYMTEVFDQDKPYDLVQVNSGAAWREARRLNETIDALPYGGLCAMLARNSYGDKRPGSGDGQHDGDIGGGQLINAYMWYMTITGDGDLTDNNYKPDYEMSNELQNMLKQACMTIYNGLEPKRVETPEEAEALRVLIIGSSRSVNTFQHLYLAIKDQMPDQDLTLGVVYYSGGSMSMHADFIRNREAVVTYYRNTNGAWELFYNKQTRDAVKDQKWDVILLQGGTGDTANNMNLVDRQYMTSLIDSWLYSHPHEYWWHTTWFNSTDPVLYENANTSLKPEDIDQVKQLTSAINSAKQYVMDDPMFDGHICSGTPLMYAINVLGVPETELYRDHTHLSDFGSLVVGYAWYTQFTGNAVTEINLDVIPAEIREPHYQDLGDLEITDEMKQVIIKTCQYTLDNPWTVPTK